MSDSKIEWCDKTWNPVTGCTPISPGCANCYAERMAHRLQAMGQARYQNGFTVTCHPEALDEPLKWKKPSRIFVCSMSDLFHDDVPWDFVSDVFARMYFSKQHTFLVLTKRPGAMLDFFNAHYSSKWPLPNVWLGVTAENQEQADKRIPVLLQIPAAKRFVSVEPMLGPINLTDLPIPYEIDRRGFNFNALTDCDDDHYYNFHAKLDHVICGGESGPGARPMHPDWVRSLRDQCQTAGTPFLFKQWGEWYPNWSEMQRIDIDYNQRHTIIGDMAFCRVGKKKAGRLLDGRLWDEYPEVHP